MTRAILTTIILITINLSAWAQGYISGNVKNTQGEAVAFANVTLYYQNDTTKIYGGTITDFNGGYEIKDVKPGDYILTASALGIKTQSNRISVSDTAKIVMDFTAEEDSKMLSEVVVKDYRTKNFTDHKEFTFSKQEVESAFDAKDLMKNVNGLKLDPISGNLKSNKSGDVKILINGIAASETDLKQLSADKIAKVEFYTIPPARYADAGTVLNVITKELTNGISGGVDLTHAVSTGFIDDEIYFNAVKGNSRFALSYTLSLRDFKHSVDDINYDYQIDNNKCNYSKHINDKFGYTDHTPVFKYTFAKTHNIVFQATVTPIFHTYFTDDKSDVIFNKSDYQILGKSVLKSDENSFGPSLDLYLSKNITDKQELSVNVVGTYYDLTQKESENGVDIADNTSIISDDMNLTNKKKSLIGELAYKVNFSETYSFSVGYKGTFANSDYKISNILSDYKTYGYASYNESDYFYGELSGGAGDNFSFRLSTGGTFVKNENDDKKYNKWMFTPQLVLGYTINETQSLSLELKSKPKIPSIAKLSNNAELLIPNVLRVGNPDLTPANLYQVEMDYTLSSDLFDIEFDAYYQHEHNAFNSYYTQHQYNGDNYILSTYQNAKNYKTYGIYYDISYYPFEDIDVTLNVYGFLEKQKLTSDLIGNHSNLYTPFFYYVEYTVGNFEINYGGNIPSMMINGSYIMSDENQSDLFLAYTFNNNIKISLGCYWFLTKSKYEAKTLDSALLNYKMNKHIDDNKSMIVLGFAWNFSKGKTLNAKQSLQNKDTDNGSF